MVIIRMNINIHESVIRVSRVIRYVQQTHIETHVRTDRKRERERESERGRNEQREREMF